MLIRIWGPSRATRRRLPPLVIQIQPTHPDQQAWPGGAPPSTQPASTNPQFNRGRSLPPPKSFALVVALMVLWLLNIGEYLQDLTLRRSRRAISELLTGTQTKAWLNSARVPRCKSISVTCNSVEQYER